ncbi:hypothetical protein ES703_124430 [subsurface metagenome]
MSFEWSEKIGVGASIDNEDLNEIKTNLDSIYDALGITRAGCGSGAGWVNLPVSDLEAVDNEHHQELRDVADYAYEHKCPSYCSGENVSEDSGENTGYCSGQNTGAKSGDDGAYCGTHNSSQLTGHLNIHYDIHDTIVKAINKTSDNPTYKSSDYPSDNPTYKGSDNPSYFGDDLGSYYHYD